ncbi:GyrI-like domain-containing protein [Xanthomonas sp. SI]|uniref:AraC family transcriptional regulator n=1 Tax=Xanthomonas sp. SI TaxID=2724123 RepID=UPI0016394D63|nr:GyrI-like domain-containing protein [Xanthomonas sp. SI]QNH11363.1 GyrI-like small molecule binding domain protein [Xanthomonas sp. SI]
MTPNNSQTDAALRRGLIQALDLPESFMEVKIVEFSETAVAAVEHYGPPELEYESSKRLILWRIRNGISPQLARTFGVHHTDPARVAPEKHRVDFCVSYNGTIEPNEEGVVAKVIPRLRCAFARHLGSRRHNATAEYLGRAWLPNSGEVSGAFPIFFHYVNVGPDVQEHEMITDVYLPLGPAAKA